MTILFSLSAFYAASGILAAALEKESRYIFLLCVFVFSFYYFKKIPYKMIFILVLTAFLFFAVLDKAERQKESYEENKKYTLNFSVQNRYGNFFVSELNKLKIWIKSPENIEFKEIKGGFIKRERHFELVNLISEQTSPLLELRKKTINKLQNLYKNYFPIAAKLSTGLVYEDERTYSLFSEAQMIHILAISGLHIGILVFLWEVFFRLSRLRLLTKAYLHVILIFLFLTYIGFLPSATRASLMFILYFTGVILRRNPAPLNIVLVSFIITSFYNPLWIFSPGYILSYTITFFLICFFKEYQLKNKIKINFAVALLCFLSSWLTVAYFFNTVSPLSIFLNFIFVPFLPVLMIFIILSLIFNAPFFAAVSESFLDFLIGFLEKLKTAEVLSFNIRSPSAFIVIIWFVALFFILKKEIRLKHKIYALVFFLIVFYFNVFEHKNYYIVFSSRGAPAVFYKGSKNILINTGYSFKNIAPPARRISRELKKQGVNKIDYVIFSSNKNNSYGGALFLSERFKIKNTLGGQAPKGTFMMNLIYEELEKKGVNVVNYESEFKVKEKDFLIYFKKDGQYEIIINDKGGVINFSFNGKEEKDGVINLNAVKQNDFERINYLKTL